MLNTLELIVEWVAAIIILAVIAYKILDIIGGIIYRRKHHE